MVQDILLDDDVDLDFFNGDFRVGPSDEQHLLLIVNFNEGSLKQFPLQGVGINSYSGSSGQGATLKRSIQVNAEADGYKNVTVILSQGTGGAFQYDINADRL